MVNDNPDRWLGRATELSKIPGLWVVILAVCLAIIGVMAGQPAPLGLPTVSAGSQALALLDVSVDKAVDHFSVEPGQSPAPLYTVTFSNPSTETVTLDAITDTLPAGFLFAGMNPSGDWHEEPVDTVEPDIVWQGPITVPATGTLTLVYAVYVPASVPPSTIPYTNTVVASVDGQVVGPASAGLYVGAPRLGLAKTATPTRVLNGEPVIYAVTVANSGELSGVVTVITDTLDPSLTFEHMAAGSDVTDPPDIAGSTLTWSGPFTVTAGDELLVRYEVTTPGGSGWSWPYNQASAWADGTLLGPVRTRIEVGPGKASAYLPVVLKDVNWARFSVTKSVTPDSLMALSGAVVTYTVTLVNEGDYPGVLGTVYDTLPPGFAYVDMVAGSDVLADPSGTTGTITWAGPFSVPAHGQLRLVFKAAINQTPGTYINTASATTLVGRAPSAPASAMVIVEVGILFEERFDSSISRWTKFLNYWRLDDSQWFWGNDDGVGGGGGATHRCCDNPKKEAEDALMMYLGEGAEQWTDYRVEAKFNLRAGAGPIGLWVRGQWEPSDIRAQWVTGYYVVVGGRATGDSHFVKITQLQTTTDCWGAACSNPENLYNFNNTHEMIQQSLTGPLTRNEWHTLVVEVRGARLVVWVDGEQAIDWTDPKEPFLTGTIGLKTYKGEEVSFDDIVVTPLQ